MLDPSCLAIKNYTKLLIQFVFDGVILYITGTLRSASQITLKPIQCGASDAIRKHFFCGSGSLRHRNLHLCRLEPLIFSLDSEVETHSLIDKSTKQVTGAI